MASDAAPCECPDTALQAAAADAQHGLGTGGSPVLPPAACPPKHLKAFQLYRSEDSEDGALAQEPLRTTSKDSEGEGGSSSNRSRRHRRFDSRSFVPERENAEISRRYIIDERPIAVGGYGQVFIAKDLLCRDRTVAIKKLLRHDDARDEALKSEIQIMKALDHPSICKIFETYVQDNVMYFVIEHLEGGDLCDRFMDERLDERTVAYIIRQASGALRYAHAMGIAHRDMKPENICFCNRTAGHNRIKVIDWGLGKHFARMRMKSSVGTGSFTAPEVLDPPSEGATYSAACDLWSLGILTYVTLSGKSPFWGGPLQMLTRMRNETYPMKGEFWESVSADGKDFIRSLLKADPEERLPSERLLSHPWLARQFLSVDHDTLAHVLSNVEHFSHAPDLLSICVASVAKQLDHRSLDIVYQVFSRLDTNGDGSLDLEETRAGFLEAFVGEGFSAEGVDEMFARLDLDGTGRITYTEFCAAGIGESSYTQEHVLWAAFKAFDIHDHGRLTRESLQQVLLDADVTETWSKSVCDDVAVQVMEGFGADGGHLDFEAWLTLMRKCASQHSLETPKRRGSGIERLGSAEARALLPKCDEGADEAS